MERVIPVVRPFSIARLSCAWSGGVPGVVLKGLSISSKDLSSL